MLYGFNNICVIVCCVDNYIDHLHPSFDIIIFKMKNSLLPVVYNKQTRLQFLALANFFNSLYFASSVLNPLSPRRDQHQIYPFNINANVAGWS